MINDIKPRKKVLSPIRVHRPPDSYPKQSNYYAIFPTIYSSSSSQQTLTHPIFFSHQSKNFTYQLKCLQSQALNLLSPSLPLPPQILASSLVDTQQGLVSPLLDLPVTLLDTLPSNLLDPLPCLQSLPVSQHPYLNSIFDSKKYPNVSFLDYVEGQSYEYGITIAKNLSRAYEIYHNKSSTGSLGCLFKLTRMSIEPELAKLFGKTCDPALTLSLFLKLFMKHGLFDSFASFGATIRQVFLFNLYLDIFPSFKSLVEDASNLGIEDPLWTENLIPDATADTRAIMKILLQLFIEEDPYSESSMQRFQELIAKSKENNKIACLLVGDLLDVNLFGVSTVHDLNRRIVLYSTAEAAGETVAAGRLVSLFETMQQFLQIKGLSTEHVQQNLEYYYERVYDQINLDILRRKLSEKMEGDIISSISEVKELYELLYYLGDKKILPEFLSILKFLQHSNLTEILKPNKQVQQTDTLQLTRGYTIEKGLGVNADPIEALKIYQEMIKKPVLDQKELKIELLYRVGSALQKTTERHQADFFLKIYTLELLKVVKERPTEIQFLYGLYKVLNKATDAEDNQEISYQLLKSIMELKAKSRKEKIWLLYVDKAWKKLEKSPKAKGKFNEINNQNERGDKDQFTPEILKLVDSIEKKLELTSYGISDIKKLQDPQHCREIVQSRLNEIMKSLTNEYEELFERLRDNWDSQSMDNDESSFLDRTSQTKTPTGIEIASSASFNQTSLLNKLTQSPIDTNTRISQMEVSRSHETKKTRYRFRSESASAHGSITANSLSFLSRPSTIQESSKREILQDAMETREKVQKFLETHKSSAYQTLTQNLYVPEKRKACLEFIKSGAKKQSQTSTGFEDYLVKEFQAVYNALPGLLEDLAHDNKVRYFKKAEFEIVENNELKRKLAKVIENRQVFEVITLEYPVEYALELIANHPLLFLIPVTFHHPQFISIYGITVSLVDNTFQVLYFMEQKGDPLKTFIKQKGNYLLFSDRINLLQQVLRILQAFHVHNVSLITLDADALFVDPDGQIKLNDIFLPLLEAPGRTNYTSRSYKGPLERLPIDIFQGSGKMSTSSDIFCFGMLMFEVLSGHRLCNPEDFTNEKDYCEKVTNGFLQQRVLQACRKGMLMLPNNKHFPYFVEETIASCLSHLKKKRPKVSSLLLSLHQVLLGPVEQEEKSKKSLNSSANFGKSFLRWNCESTYTMDAFIKQQYTVLKFAETPSQSHSHLILPGLASYRGAIKDKVPNGEGELMITDVLGYTGNFYDGFIHGNGKVNMFRRQETLIGKFWKGFPVEGTMSNATTSLKIWFEDVSWIPTKDYRTKMIEGFKNLDSKFSRNLRIQDPNMLDDTRNRNLIKSYVDFVSRSGICGSTKAQLVDCFGNFYYFPGGFAPQVAPSSLVIKKVGPIELSMKVYKAKISMETMLGVEFSALDISMLDEKSTNPLRSCSNGNFEQVSRYFHFGCKYYGHMQANKLNKGIVYMNYSDYFWFDGSGKVYSGAKYTRLNKCLYIGDIFSSKAEGFGMEYIEAEKRYEGEYKDGRPHGRGIAYTDFGRLEFRGIFSDGKPLYGFYYERNSVYEGKFRQIFSPNVEYIIDQEPSRDLQDDLAKLEIITSENLKPSFMERMNIQPETCRRRPIFESISPTESDSDSLDEPVDEKIRKTEFEGTVQNFSENIKELRGKFIIEDRRFNGKFCIHYVDGSLYDGELKNGIREGYGIYKKPNGTEFEGIWKAGVLKGKIEWRKGSTKIDYSEGEFSKERTGGAKQNGFGRIKFKNGDYYEGETKDGIMNGFGKLWESSGRVYEGTLRNGRKDGLGKLWEQSNETGNYYEGGFKEGQREGFGVVYKNNREVFKGKFVRDKPKIGKLIRNYTGKNDNKEEKELFYIGEVALDKHQRIVAKGWGRLVLENKMIKGVFEADNLVDGVGLMMYGKAEEIKNGVEGVVYFGEIEKGLENGFGMKDYKKGDADTEVREGKDVMERYEGQWIDGERKGLARAWYTDKVEGQKLYRGEYDNQKEGLGEWQMQEDVNYRGEFKEGERDGRGTLYKKGKKILGLYSKGSIQRMIYDES